MRSRPLPLLAILSLLFLAISASAETTATATVYGFRATANTKAVLGPTLMTPPRAIDLITPGKAQAVLDAVADLPSSLRFDGSGKGDLVRIFFFYREDGVKAAEVQIEEKSRRLLIADQFKTLIRVASAVAAGPPPVVPPPPMIVVERFDYRLKVPRATLKITAEIKANPDSAESADGADPQWFVVIDFTDGLTRKKNPTGPTSVTALTGAREAWSLSADVPLSSIGDVKVDDKAENIALADTPENFYVGLNFAPRGDALRPLAGFWEAITIKGLLKASRRPSDSFGVGIGLRPGLFSNSLSEHSFLQIFDTLSPYVAYTRSRVEEDQTKPDGTTEKVRFKRNDFVIGISLDLEKALGFVKGAGGEEEKKEE